MASANLNKHYFRHTCLNMTNVKLSSLVKTSLKLTRTLLLIYFYNKILELSKYSNYRKITKYTALEMLTQDPKINKLWTLAKLLEGHASHTRQFFVTGVNPLNY